MIETVTLRPQVENIHGAFRPQEPRGAPCGPRHVVRLLSMWNTLSVRRGREKTCQYLGHVSSNAKPLLIFINHCLAVLCKFLVL